jgi:isocitrate dehydrogenase (NAD+)
MLNAAVDMLEHLGHHYHADMIQKAVDRTVNEDRIHTPGIFGKISDVFMPVSFVKVTFVW